MLPVIMCGGSGTRLWPLSRSLYPKQFLPLAGERTMLQETVRRLEGLTHHAPIAICNENHRFIVAEQLRQADGGSGRIILEPQGRNTAPAIALAALAARQGGEDPLLLVLAADHLIQDIPAFHRAIATAQPLAEAGQLVTFGIVPSRPHTGYGYIRAGDGLVPNGVEGAFEVAQFVEKPDQDSARHYLERGDYYWNSGMFLFRASRYLAELEQFRPDIYQACSDAMARVAVDMDFIRPDSAAFMDCPEDSVDYAVMEKTASAVVVPMSAGWSDVGCWSALWDVSDKDDRGNVSRGDVIQHDSRNTYVDAHDKLVTTIGLEDVVVVETKDAVLVAHKGRVQEVKHIVEQLKRDDRSEVHQHRDEYRPWGRTDSIDAGVRHQVKRISVKPGASISRQMHHHRAEHWIVVSGTARVTVGDNSFLVTENESTYIPVGQIHALENPGLVPLEMIEVQSGSYLGEDDIVRLEEEILEEEIEDGCSAT